MTAPIALVPCACGQPAAYVAHDGRPLCDRCNPGLCAPHPQAARLPYPDWLVQRRHKRLAALLAGDDLGEGPGLDTYDLNDLRWLNTLGAVTERAQREERDAWQGAAARNSRVATAAEVKVRDLAAALDAAQRERDALRAAVSAYFALCNHCAVCGKVAVWYSRIHGEHYCDSEACKPERDQWRAKECLSRSLSAEERAMLALLPPEAP